MAAHQDLSTGGICSLHYLDSQGIERLARMYEWCIEPWSSEISYQPGAMVSLPGPNGSCTYHCRIANTGLFPGEWKTVWQRKPYGK
jgi:hypothetical protein